MATRRYQVALAGDSTLPRDKVVNTLYFNHTALEPDDEDLEQMCLDLANAYDNWWTGAGVREITVKAYELGGPPPHIPRAEKVINAGLAPSANVPREVAICLSFHDGQNRPRHRGRIYLPVFTCGAVGSIRDQLQQRPTSTLRDRVMIMADQLKNIGGVDVDWCVYSGLDQAGRKVQYAWVDDEWDTQRRRGLKPTTRTAAAVDE